MGRTDEARWRRREICCTALAAGALLGTGALRAASAVNAAAPGLLQLTGRDSGHVLRAPLPAGLDAPLHPAAAAAFLELRGDARRAGLDLRVLSGFRSFTRQARIWNDKAAGRRPVLDAHEKPLDIMALSARERVFAILRWSALPGASRHHWGTEADVYDRAAGGRNYRVKLSSKEAQTVFSELHRWLDERISKGRAHGFYRPYTGAGGIGEEPWHLSYRPLAADCAERLTPAVVRAAVAASDIALRETVLQHFAPIYRDFVAPYIRV